MQEPYDFSYSKQSSKSLTPGHTGLHRSVLLILSWAVLTLSIGLLSSCLMGETSEDASATAEKHPQPGSIENESVNADDSTFSFGAEKIEGNLEKPVDVELKNTRQSKKHSSAPAKKAKGKSNKSARNSGYRDLDLPGPINVASSGHGDGIHGGGSLGLGGLGHTDIRSDKNRRKRESRVKSKPRLALAPNTIIQDTEASDEIDNIRIFAPPAHEKADLMIFRDYGVNPTLATRNENTSTFSVDVDTASYNLARNYLERRQMPNQAAIRVEEMINAFNYEYANPSSQGSNGDDVFAVQAEVFPSPNRQGYHVLHIGIKGKEVTQQERKAANLVFVIDVSGSMQRENRLGLVKRSLRLLANQLDSRDSVGIIAYGSNAQEILSPTRVTESGRRQIMRAVERLHSNGSTNAMAGLDMGYRLADEAFIKSGINRIILCSDGVANTGMTSPEGLNKRYKRYIKNGVTLSAVGFGMGNYNDVLMEQLADAGNGNYAYIDDISAAKKLFVEKLTGTLQVIAKDVKIQMVFNNETISRYRLLGFENRLLKKQDFANDRVDAGEIGAGHTVTAIYEIKLNAQSEGGLGQLRLRYKSPQGSVSQLIQKTLPRRIIKDSYQKASAPTQLSFVAAGFGEKLRGSYWVRNLSYQDLLSLWDDIPRSLRKRSDVQELRDLIVMAKRLDTRGDRFEKVIPLASMDFDRIPVLR